MIKKIIGVTLLVIVFLPALFFVLFMYVGDLFFELVDTIRGF